jgi:hypothetical protein
MKIQSNLLVKKALTIEVVLRDANQYQFSFGDIPDLRGKAITGISVRSATELPKTKSGKNQPDIKNFYLTLIEKNVSKTINDVPLIEFAPSFNDGNYMRVDHLFINFPESYLACPSSGGPYYNAGEAVQITFFYDLQTAEDLLEAKLRAQNNKGQSCG